MIDHFWAEPVIGGAVGFHDDGDCDVEAAGRCAQVESTGGGDVLVITAYGYGNILLIASPIVSGIVGDPGRCLSLADVAHGIPSPVDFVLKHFQDCHNFTNLGHVPKNHVRHCPIVSLHSRQYVSFGNQAKTARLG